MVFAVGDELAEKEVAVIVAGSVFDRVTDATIIPLVKGSGTQTSFLNGRPKQLSQISAFSLIVFVGCGLCLLTHNHLFVIWPRGRDN